MVPVSALKRVGKLLIDIHGQHEHRPRGQQKSYENIRFVGDEEISKYKTEVSRLYKEYSQIQSQIEELEKDI